MFHFPLSHKCTLILERLFVLFFFEWWGVLLFLSLWVLFQMLAKRVDFGVFFLFFFFLKKNSPPPPSTQPWSQSFTWLFECETNSTNASPNSSLFVTYAGALFFLDPGIYIPPPFFPFQGVTSFRKKTENLNKSSKTIDIFMGFSNRWSPVSRTYLTPYLLSAANVGSPYPSYHHPTPMSNFQGFYQGFVQLIETIIAK